MTVEMGTQLAQEIPPPVEVEVVQMLKVAMQH
jgi:hypothetical protein